MQQPELGQKIAALRKIKGLTQEELCSACGINIRSLQRIEAGKVNPRSYTLKSISEHLDYDFVSRFAQGELADSSKTEEQLSAVIKTAWISGIAYFLFAIPDMVFTSLRANEELSHQLDPWYVLVSLGVIVSGGVFYYGFATLGKYWQNSILSIGSYLLIFLLITIYGLDLLTFRSGLISSGVLGMMHLLGFGVMSIVFGVGLARLESKVGSIAKYAAILEIATGVSLMLIITVIFSLFTFLPALVLEIILLHKVYQQFRQQQTEFKLAT